MKRQIFCIHQKKHEVKIILDLSKEIYENKVILYLSKN